MLILTCPYCGVAADETELAPGGEAHLRRAGPAADEAEFEAYMFHRANPRGVHFERWRHAFGCGKWFHAARCTMTLEVFGTYSAQCTEPPAAIFKAILASRPDWTPAPGQPEPPKPAARARKTAAKPAAKGKAAAKTPTAPAANPAKADAKGKGDAT